MSLGPGLDGLLRQKLSESIIKAVVGKVSIIRRMGVWTICGTDLSVDTANRASVIYE